MSRPLTPHELDVLRHDVVSLAVRAGRAMWAVRLQVPDDVDRDAASAALGDALAATRIGRVELLWSSGDDVRVVGGAFG